MKLQLALDDIGLEEGLALLDRVRDWVDIAEVGTPMVMAYGMEAVRAIRARHPGREILADLKIMDAGAYEAELAFRAGADYVTVLGVTDDLTLRGCVEAARSYGAQTVVDMICVDDLAARVAAAEAMGADYVSVHVGVDRQAAGVTPLEALRAMRACVRTAKISVAGGIGPDTVSDYLRWRPDVVIVGSGITHAPDPVAAARALRGALMEVSLR